MRDARHSSVVRGGVGGGGDSILAYDCDAAAAAEERVPFRGHRRRRWPRACASGRTDRGTDCETDMASALLCPPPPPAPTWDT